MHYAEDPPCLVNPPRMPNGLTDALADSQPGLLTVGLASSVPHRSADSLAHGRTDGPTDGWTLSRADELTNLPAPCLATAPRCPTARTATTSSCGSATRLRRQAKHSLPLPSLSAIGNARWGPVQFLPALERLRASVLGVSWCGLWQDMCA